LRLRSLKAWLFGEMENGKWKVENEEARKNLSAFQSFSPSTKENGKDKGEKVKFSIFNFPFSISPSPRPAFTLAEVLITLGIIGVIAVMVIKPLIDNATKTQTVTGVKKAYATLSGAYQALIAEYDDIETAINAFSGKDGSLIALAFFSKMNIAKNCGFMNGYDTGCFPTEKSYKQLNGNDQDENFSSYHTAVTSDGMAWGTSDADKSCNIDLSGGDPSNPLSATCSMWFVDINGSNKGPNKMGRDMFFFYLTRTGIYPAGAYRSDWDGTAWGYNCTSSDDNGTTCAARILKEDAVNY
jgi:prepilin-type N-terminal cleavage/methylation domain-containing protein